MKQARAAGKGPEAVAGGLAPAAMGCPYTQVYFQSVVHFRKGGEHGAGSLGPVVCVWRGVGAGAEHLQQEPVRPRQESVLKVASGGPIYNRALIPEGPLRGQPSRVTSQARAGQAEPGHSRRCGGE